MKPSLDTFVRPKPPLDSFVQHAQPAAPGYLDRVGAGYQGVAQNIMRSADQFAATPDLQAGSGTPVLEAIGIEAQKTGALLRSALRTVGGAAAQAFTPVVELPGIKQGVEFVANRVAQLPAAQELIKSATELSQKRPELAKDLFDVVSIATLGTGSAAQKPLLNEARAIGQDVAAGTKALLTPSEEAIQSRVVSLFQKSIKPTPKKTLQQSERYESDVLNALKTIKANADSLNIEDVSGELVAGRTPQTIYELAQGLDQTKKLVFTQYDALAKKAGTAGATIDAKPIADEVGKVAQNKALQLANPGEVIDYAKGWQDRLRNLDVLDAETTQEVIKLMNTNLDAFYRNPTYDTASKVTIDAGIANNFRAALDKAIEGATGEQYQVLKNQYAALKSIENDVVRASLRDARKNVKGLLDYTDMFTGGQMVAGILSMNPAMFTKGAIERGFKEYIKYLNDPNRAIKNIFDSLNIEPSTKGFEPVSATGKALKYPSLGLSIEDVTSQRFQRRQSMTSNTMNTNSSKSGTTPDSSTLPAKGKTAAISGMDEFGVIDAIHSLNAGSFLKNGKLNLDLFQEWSDLVAKVEKKGAKLTNEELRHARELLRLANVKP